MAGLTPLDLGLLAVFVGEAEKEGERGERRRGEMLSCSEDSEDFRLKFPLHLLVWENDYRNLEKELPMVTLTHALTSKTLFLECILSIHSLGGLFLA